LAALQSQQRILFNTMPPQIIALLLFALGTAAMPALAGVENEVQVMVQRGEIKPFKDILNRVVSQTRGDYIGAEFDSATRVYRFRFLDNGSVKNVDVDARTGDKVRRTRVY